MKILLADDDPVSLKMLAKIVEKLGHTPIAVGNGLDALASLRGGEAWLAVLDWMMPGMSGPDICAALRSEDPSRIMYTIILTAREGPGEVTRALEKGANDYLTKPFDRAELRARIGVGVRTVELELELAELNKKLARLARTDSLTGLLNHGAIIDILEQKLLSGGGAGRPTSLLMLDLDRFKQTNDRYGHQIGDRVLVRLAEVLGERCIDTGAVGRYGGEEFLMVLGDTEADRCHRIAEAIRKAVEEMDLSDVYPGLEMTISIGACTSADSNGTTAELVAKADSALYRAKREGRNRVCFC